MKRRAVLAAALTTCVLTSGLVPAGVAAPGLSERAVDGAGFTPLPDKPDERATAEVVKAEILLSRVRFSPGAIDGVDGDNFRNAVRAYQMQMALPVSGRLDRGTWDRLSSDGKAPLTVYTVTRDDVAGPFTPTIPTQFEAQSKLKRLGYRDVKEALAERFHMSEPLLLALNPASRLRAGDRIVVPDVDVGKPGDKVARVVVDKSGHDVEALAADGRLLAFYPASIGSEEKPAPTGDFEIRRVVHHPDYTYLPKFHFKGVSSKQPFTIAPGPNNPVGVVWMELSSEGYGIHGTPDPEAVGKTQSHGCIRLTNWDAESLAAMVDKGTPVSFGDVPGSTGPAPPAPATTPPGSQPVASQPAPAPQAGGATSAAPPAALSVTAPSEPQPMASQPAPVPQPADAAPAAPDVPPPPKPAT